MLNNYNQKCQIMKKNEFLSEIRGSKQVLYQNQLYNKCLGINYKCLSCHSLLNIDEVTMLVGKDPTPHRDHEQLSDCHIADMSTTIAKIYVEGLGALTSQGYLKYSF